MSRQSLACVFRGQSGSVELEYLPTPVPAGKEILVRIESCTLCGSDLHSLEGRRAVPVPTILGHEIVGRIEQFGPDANRCDSTGKALEIGSRVVWSVVASCGQCFYCQRRLPQKCLQSTKYGHEVIRPGRELLGGLAEHCLLVAGTAIVSVPDSIDLGTISPSSCATATIAAAWDAIDFRQGETVCITGAGLLGLTASAMAKLKNASAIIVCDVNPQRRRRALDFGATHAVSPEQLEETIRSVTDGRGVDIALEVSGAPAAFQSLWNGIRLGGSLVLIGSVFPSSPIPIAMEQIVRRNLTIHGIHNYAPHHLVQAVQFLEQSAKLFPFDTIVSKWFPLADVAIAFKEAQTPTNIRIGVLP